MGLLLDATTLNHTTFPQRGGGAGGGHVGRGGGCFTMDFYRFPMDFGGSVARRFALVVKSYLSGLDMTFWHDFRMIQKTEIRMILHCFAWGS